MAATGVSSAAVSSSRVTYSAASRMLRVETESITCSMHFHDESDGNAMKCTLTSSSATGVSFVVTSPALLCALLLTLTPPAEADGNDNYNARNDSCTVLRELFRRAEIGDCSEASPPHVPLLRRGGHVRLEPFGPPVASAWSLLPTPAASSSISAAAAVVPQPVTPSQLRDDPRFCEVKSAKDARQAAARGGLFFVYEGPPGRLDYVEVSGPADVGLVRVAVAVPVPTAGGVRSAPRLVLVNLSSSGSSSCAVVQEDLEALLKKKGWARLFAFPAVEHDLGPLLHRAARGCVVDIDDNDGNDREKRADTVTSPSAASSRRAPPRPSPPPLTRKSVSLYLARRSQILALAKAYLMKYIPQLGLTSNLIALKCPPSATTTHPSSHHLILERSFPPPAIAGGAAEGGEDGGCHVTLRVTAERAALPGSTSPLPSSSSLSSSSSMPVDVYVTATSVSTDASASSPPGLCSRALALVPPPGTITSCLLRGVPARERREGDGDAGSSGDVVLVDENDRKKLRIVESALSWSAKLLARSRGGGGDSSNNNNAPPRLPAAADPADVLADVVCRCCCCCCCGIADDADAGSDDIASTAPIEPPLARKLPVRMSIPVTSAATSPPANEKSCCWAWDIDSLRTGSDPSTEVTMDDLMERALAHLLRDGDDDAMH